MNRNAVCRPRDSHQLDLFSFVPVVRPADPSPAAEAKAVPLRFEPPPLVPAVESPEIRLEPESIRPPESQVPQPRRFQISEAERLGENAFHELFARHQQRLKREQEKGQYAFQVRREALGRLGLPEVRQHRLKRLGDEELAWAAELRKREQILPDLQPVILLRVEAGNG